MAKKSSGNSNKGHSGRRGARAAASTGEKGSFGSERIRTGVDTAAHVEASATVSDDQHALVESMGAMVGLPLPGLESTGLGVEAEGADDGFAPDAWFAEYGTTVSRALAAGLSAELQPEVIIGRDDRKRIHNTDEYPFRCICSLDITAASGRRFVGTGWLVSPSLVITAGHCVYMRKQGGWVRSIEVYPGRNGRHSTPPYVAHKRKLMSVNGWVNNRNPLDDYAGIVLDRPLGDQLGWFGFDGDLPKQQLEGELVNVVGYPFDKDGTMWGHARSLSQVNDQELIYLNDTLGGNSGGPVILWDGNQNLVVGIHNYGDLRGNSATRINKTVGAKIVEWMADAG